MDQGDGTGEIVCLPILGTFHGEDDRGSYGKAATLKRMPRFYREEEQQQGWKCHTLPCLVFAVFPRHIVEFCACIQFLQSFFFLGVLLTKDMTNVDATKSQVSATCTSLAIMLRA